MGFTVKMKAYTHKESHWHTCGTSSWCSSVNHLNSIPMPTIDIYKGARDAKEIDNFLYNLERFFDFNGINDDASRINNASIYL